jgi:hypothetical protein
MVVLPSVKIHNWAWDRKERAYGRLDLMHIAWPLGLDYWAIRPSLMTLGFAFFYQPQPQYVTLD